LYHLIITDRNVKRTGLEKDVAINDKNNIAASLFEDPILGSTHAYRFTMPDISNDRSSAFINKLPQLWTTEIVNDNYLCTRQIVMHSERLHREPDLVVIVIRRHSDCQFHWLVSVSSNGACLLTLITPEIIQLWIWSILFQISASFLVISLLHLDRVSSQPFLGTKADPQITTPATVEQHTTRRPTNGINVFPIVNACASIVASVKLLWNDTKIN
jgi:hypothetical protein